MFRCQNETCGVVVQHRQPVNRVVTERREKIYKKPVRKRRRGKIIGYEDVFGWEISKQIDVCPDCFRELTGKEPRAVVREKKVTTEKYKGFNTRPPRRKKWQNPRAKKGGLSSQTKSENSQGDTKSESSSRRKPIVEKVNPLKVITE